MIALTVAPVSALAAGQATRDAIREGLPRYDPEVRRRYLATPQANESPASVVPRPARGTPREAEESKRLEASGEMLTLPEMQVRARSGAKGDGVTQLPRMIVRPQGDKERPGGFETEAERDARLVKKHLSVFDRMFLNRFNLFGVSKEKRAREAEAIERSAQQLNEVADALELRQLEQGETEKGRELRKIYLDTLLSRPK